MLVMTAKLDKKKIAMILAVVIVAAVALIALLGGGNKNDLPTAASAITTNDDRVKFLSDFGWDVTVSPAESGQVRIPSQTTEVYERYNALQKSQGYDLTPYAGKNVMRYVYRINNFPGATEPVYATLLIYKNQVIGGDITDTAAQGAVRGFQMPAQTEKAPAATVPETTAAPAA